MARKRRRYDAKFKARVALDAVKNQQTIGELASEHGVHPTLIRDWKRQLVARSPELFQNGRNGQDEAEEKLAARLYEERGRLKAELDWLQRLDGREGASGDDTEEVAESPRR